MNTRRPWIRLISMVAVSSALAATLSGCGEDDADPVATASDTPSEQAEPSEPPTTSPATGSVDVAGHGREHRAGVLRGGHTARTAAVP